MLRLTIAFVIEVTLLYERRKINYKQLNTTNDNDFVSNTYRIDARSFPLRINTSMFTELPTDVRMISGNNKEQYTERIRGDLKLKNTQTRLRYIFD